ncbi:hypothetical protein ACFPA1_19350 [Neobacillus sp. GCM10023253]
MYIYGNDYIKYLNDDSAGHLTYDQWKMKKSQQGTDKCASCGTVKEHLQPCPKCRH